jgi:Rrf2 family transcriptional regulator, nitric oxide-sensitive transcriptional repressor
MELSRFTDYSLRVLIYATAKAPEKITLAELTKAYRISQHHLVKIVHHLGKLGYLDNKRGRNGGIYLGRNPNQVSVGDVVRRTETHMDLVECFSAKHNACRLFPSCRLMGALIEARDAFLGVLDSYTLADLASNKKSILNLLRQRAA